MLSARGVSLLVGRSGRGVLQRWAAAAKAQDVTAKPVVSRRWMAGGHTPVPRSSTAELWQGHPKTKEGWEGTIYFYYGVSFVAIFCIINFSPDTTIEAWAQQEARARLALKDKGFTDFEFGKHYSDETVSGDTESWDKFTMKSIKPGEDDDDDEEEEEEEEENDDDDE